jgi:hypothetical protein
VAWAIPSPATRAVAIVFTPVIVAVALAWVCTLPLRPQRFVTAVLLGIALRPVVHAPELLVETLAAVWHRGVVARIVLESLASLAWLAPVVVVTFVVNRTRGRAHALAFAIALTAGLAGASLGGVLASRGVPHPIRAMTLATLATVPRTLLFAAIAVRIGWRSYPRALLGTAVAMITSVALEEATRTAHRSVLGSASLAAGLLVALAAIVLSATRASRTRDAAAPIATSQNSV